MSGASEETRPGLLPARTVWMIVGALVVLRLVVAALIPLAFDETYYWLWSKHLAGGYYDHPPMVAYVIRLGTAMAGDTQLGIRIASILLVLPATWAVWRSAEILFKSQTIAAMAALYFNLTLIVAAGTLIVTPDSPLIVFAAFILLFLAKVYETGRGAWWLPVGAAAGLALMSKYSALFLGVSIVITMLAIPQMRRWFLSPWPYLGGMVAIAVFVPVIEWNAAHEMASFVKQFGRAVVHEFTLRYIGELIPAQIGLATPGVFILGSAALWAFARGRLGQPGARVIIAAMIWPMFVYFVWHSLHQRVQANWFAPLYPAFAIAAAVAACELRSSGFAERILHQSRRTALPVAVGLFLIAALQAATGIIPAGTREPTAQKLGAGMADLGRQLDQMRVTHGANGVLTTGYALTGWLAFYLPSRPPVIQVNERLRWINAPAPDRLILQGPLLYVVETSKAASGLKEMAGRYAKSKPLGEVARTRRGLTLETYRVFLVDGANGDPLVKSATANP